MDQETVSQREEVGQDLIVEFEPISGDNCRIAAKYDGRTLDSVVHGTKILGSAQLRGQFLNSVESSLGDLEVDEQAARQSFKEWFADMHELYQEEESERFLTVDQRAIIDGTEAVEIHGGETTKWVVTLNIGGTTEELEFTYKEMVSGGARVLEEKIANQFYEFIDIEKEDWPPIRDRWEKQANVTHVVEETASDAVADRLLEYISNNSIVVADREHLTNDNAAVWFDESNATMYDEAGADESIAWVQDSFLVDQIENVGKDIGYKGELVQNLIDRADLHGGNIRRSWEFSQRTKVYPFAPEALGISDDDVGGTDTPAHSEVSA